MKNKILNKKIKNSIQKDFLVAASEGEGAVVNPLLFGTLSDETRGEETGMNVVPGNVDGSLMLTYGVLVGYSIELTGAGVGSSVVFLQ